MKRFICLFVLCLLVAFTVIGCNEKTVEKLTRVELHEVTRSVFYAPQYVAASLGYFADEGLDVNIVTSGGSDKAMTALLSNQADICLAGPETGVYVYNEGRTDYPVVVGQLTKRDGSYLIGREAVETFDWAQLEGSTVIGGRKGGMPCMTLLYVMNQHGLVPGENITVIDSIQFNLMGGAFEGGEGDYVTLFEPTATEFENAGKGYIVENVGLASGEIPYTTYMVSQDTLTKDATFVERFVTAVYRAQQWIMTASDTEIAEAMQPFFPDTSLESLIIVANSYKKTDSWKQEPVMYAEDYNRLLDVIDGSGELSARPPFDKLIDNRIAETVMAD